jgi:hypothetical protein
MMTTEAMQWAKWPALLLAAGLLTCFTGCTSTRGPTPAEFPQIIAAVRQSLAGQQGELSDSAPVDIRIKNRVAVVRYSAQYRMLQLVFYPMQAEVRFTGNAWVVVSNTSDWSWRQSLIFDTIGK